MDTSDVNNGKDILVDLEGISVVLIPCFVASGTRLAVANDCFAHAARHGASSACACQQTSKSMNNSRPEGE
jgi:hypothetical protein